MAVACKMSFTPYSADTKLSYDFYKNALIAMSEGAKKFDAADTTYELELERLQMEQIMLISPA